LLSGQNIDREWIRTAFAGVVDKLDDAEKPMQPAGQADALAEEIARLDVSHRHTHRSPDLVPAEARN